MFLALKFEPLSIISHTLLELESLKKNAGTKPLTKWSQNWHWTLVLQYLIICLRAVAVCWFVVGCVVCARTPTSLRVMYSVERSIWHDRLAAFPTRLWCWGTAGGSSVLCGHRNSCLVVFSGPSRGPSGPKWYLVTLSVFWWGVCKQRTGLLDSMSILYQCVPV